MEQVKEAQKNASSGTAITLQELIALRIDALHLSQVGLRKKLILPGQKLTTIRGRGIEFDATREYQAGDDIRSMAWRVTARSLKPHIKVYREEKERPMWLALDLSPSLYFGTRCMFKSVKSIMQAALTGWSSLLKRERIGAIIAADQKPHVFQPKSDEKYYLGILNSLAEFSRLQPVFDEKNYFHALLTSLLQHVRSGNLLHIFSDFQSFNNDSEKLIIYLAQKSHVILNFIYDPFEAAPPPPYRYMLTNGLRKSVFDMQDTHNRENYRRQYQVKVQQLTDFARKHHMAFNMYCTSPRHCEERSDEAIQRAEPLSSGLLRRYAPHNDGNGENEL